MGDAVDLHLHRWVPGATASAPVLVLLHGTGGNEDDLLSLGATLAPGAALLSPRGNVLEQGAPRFFRRLAEGVFDVDDLHRRSAQLGEFLTAAAERYRFDVARTHAVGFSNGANIAASMLLSGGAPFAGAVLFRAMVPFEPETPPSLADKHVLLSEGRADPLVPIATGERLAELFRAAGAELELAWQAGGHGLVPNDVKLARRWLGDRFAR
ncbi:MAG: alpha/beta hydrolase [Gemmatimonadaceae bacterium]|nr:alpha/beta hydrolase [Gemmatimonadaceae bacterium]